MWFCLESILVMFQNLACPVACPENVRAVWMILTFEVTDQTVSLVVNDDAWSAHESENFSL